MTDALFWLVWSGIATVLFSLPYVMERIVRVGLIPALGYSNYGTGGFEQPEEQPAKWARRAYAAHRNALESLPLLAIFVLVAHVTNTAGAFVAQAAMIYFFARLAYFVVYVMGIPALRTLLFFVSLAAILAIALKLLGTL